MSERTGPGGIALVVVLMLAAVGGFYVFANQQRMFGRRRHHHRPRCSSNLKQIGYGLHLYSSDWNEEFPESLPVLYEAGYFTDNKVFVCGNASDQVVRFTEGDPFTDNHVSYCYVSGVHPTDPPEYVVAFDEEWNHEKSGLNVLYTGGNVQWLADLDLLHDQLAKQEKEFAAKGRTMTVLRPGWSVSPADGLSWR
jgi:hypothetical protein